jgi:hypothetical protein
VADLLRDPYFDICVRRNQSAIHLFPVLIKKFTIRLLLFLLPLVIIAYPADVFLSQRLKYSNGYAAGELEVWKDLVDHKINADVVIYGSSRACHHINPSIITDSLKVEAYNLGMTGHRFHMHQLRHDLLLEYSQPKLIIYSLDLFSFQKRKGLYNPDQFLPYIRNNETISERIKGYEGYTAADHQIPLLRFYGKKAAIVHVFKSFFRKWPPSRVKGFEGLNRAVTANFDTLSPGVIKLDTQAVREFEKFIADCTARNIRVLLVYSPEYVKAQHITKNRAEVIGLYRTISERTKVPFIDYSQHPISFDKKNFADQTHLNARSANAFTALLVKEIRPLLR